MCVTGRGSVLNEFNEVELDIHSFIHRYLFQKNVFFNVLILVDYNLNDLQIQSSI